MTHHTSKVTLTARRSSLLLSALALLDCSLIDSGSVAEILELAGEVSVRTETDENPRLVEVGTDLHIGDVIHTGENGYATLEFGQGSLILMQPNTSLVVRRGGGTAAKIGALLLSGQVRAKSSSQSLRLSIGTPFGLTEIGEGTIEIDISAKQGLVVRVGQVKVVDESGEQKTLEAGTGLTIGGLVIPLRDPTIAGLTAVVEAQARAQNEVVLTPIRVTLVGNPRQVQVKRAGENRWRVPTKRDVLKPGDRVRTRRAQGTTLQMGDEANVTLAPGSEFVLSEAQMRDGRHEARYGLASGGARVRLRTGSGDTYHALILGDGEVKLRPSVHELEADIGVVRGRRAEIQVRRGQALLDDGTVLPAGTRGLVEAGRLVGTVEPLVPPKVVLREQSAAIIHYSRGVPAVGLSWKQLSPTDEHLIEVARDRGFTDVLARERMPSGSLVLTDLVRGRYYWRVHREGEDDLPRSVFTITRNTVTECVNCKRNNVVDDTGEKTVVYFQQTLPSITLRWERTPLATLYRLKLFADGEFDTPVVDRSVEALTARLPAGTLNEGKYYWLVTGHNAQGEEISTSPRMNILEIAYDNAVVDLQIKLPKDGSRVSAGKLVTSGEVQLGASLAINGRQVVIDKKGRFRRVLNLDRGSNQIVYRTLAKDGVERYYLREVFRR